MACPITLSSLTISITVPGWAIPVIVTVLVRIAPLSGPMLSGATATTGILVAVAGRGVSVTVGVAVGRTATTACSVAVGNGLTISTKVG